MGMQKQEKAVLVVALVDCISIGIKLTLAVFTGSLSLLADAWHSIGDLATTVMVFLALLLDRREREHELEPIPGKVKIMRRSSWEPRACAVIGVALVAVAAGVFRKVVAGSGIGDIRYPVPAALVVLFLIMLNFIRFHFEAGVGKETNSPALVADAYHSKVDIYALFMVLASMISQLLQLRIDRWVAGLIALMILAVALKTIHRAFSIMLNRSSATEPGSRTLEDNLILSTTGFLSSGGGSPVSKFVAILKPDSPEALDRLQRRSIVWISTLAVAAWLISGFFTVSSREAAVIERFGRPVTGSGHVGPGLHYDWPWPVSVVRRVDIETVRWMRLGYETKERKETILWTNAHYLKEYSILTGDGTIVDLAANLHYCVVDPIKYIYSAGAPEETLRMIADDVLRAVAGKRALFNVLAQDRLEAENESLMRIQQLSDFAGLGVSIRQICFLDVHPPMEVAASFEDVVSAQEDLETTIEEARGYHRQRIPLAEAEAYDMKKNAESYAASAIRMADGRAQAYSFTATAFKLHEAVNRHRKRMESLEAWMPGKHLWIIDPALSRMIPDLFISEPGTSIDKNNIVTGGYTVED